MTTLNQCERSIWQQGLLEYLVRRGILEEHATKLVQKLIAAGNDSSGNSDEEELEAWAEEFLEDCELVSGEWRMPALEVWNVLLCALDTFFDGVQQLKSDAGLSIDSV